MGAIVGAKCILLKIRGCHGTPGTHANTPSVDLNFLTETSPIANINAQKVFFFKLLSKKIDFLFILETGSSGKIENSYMIYFCQMKANVKYHFPTYFTFSNLILKSNFKF